MARRFEVLLVTFAVAGMMLALYGSIHLTTRLLRPLGF